MRNLTTMFTVNGVPIFAPDDDLAVSYEDLDSSASGRTENGVMHRVVVRYKVGTWSLNYEVITPEELDRMEQIFPDAPDFIFGHPDRKDHTRIVYSRCYRSKYGNSWTRLRPDGSGEVRHYKFNIIEC